MVSEKGSRDATLVRAPASPAQLDSRGEELGGGRRGPLPRLSASFAGTILGQWVSSTVVGQFWQHKALDRTENGVL